MVGDSILRATDSVVISTGGRPVLADNSFSLPISAVEFISTGVPVRSKSSRVPNIFVALVAEDSPLLPTYSPDEPKNWNEKSDHCFYFIALIVTPLPFTVFEYFEQYPTCFTVGRAHHMGNNRIAFEL